MHHCIIFSVGIQMNTLSMDIKLVMDMPFKDSTSPLCL
jgi:hypothetical protein